MRKDVPPRQTPHSTNAPGTFSSKHARTCQASSTRHSRGNMVNGRSLSRTRPSSRISMEASVPQNPALVTCASTSHLLQHTSPSGSQVKNNEQVIPQYTAVVGTKMLVQTGIVIQP